MFKSLNPHALSLAMPFDEALSLARLHGFAGLDLPPGESLVQLAQATSIQEVKEHYISSGIRPGGWSLPVDFRSTHEAYQAGLALLPAYAALARALESPWCFTWILSYSDERDYEANMAWHVRALRPVAEILAANECRLGLEFLGPATLRQGHNYPFFHTMDGALELANRIGTGNVGLLLDCWHWYTSHGTVADLARLSAREVVYVHVNDAPPERGIDEQIDVERLLPGASGVIDIVSFLRELARMNYDGPVVVEPFNAEVRALAPPERAAAAARSLERIWLQAGIAR